MEAPTHPLRRALVALVVVAVATGAGVVAWRATADGDPAPAAGAPTAALATATVEQRDLVTYDEVDGSLAFTTAVAVVAGASGTVTSVLAEGSTIDAGTVVASVDGAPVVALVGEVPAYRTLELGAEPGPDVLALEQNLVALGYDPAGAVTVDWTFDRATEAAVQRWEAALGTDADGSVGAGDVVFVPGAVLVDTVAVTTGSTTRAGATLVSGRLAQRRVLVPFTVGDGGTVAATVAPGTPVVDGTLLAVVGGDPVLAMTGDVATEPGIDDDLAVGDDGRAVELLERALVATGDAGVGSTADGTFDDATAAAWRHLLERVGADDADDADEVTVPAGSVVVVPAGLTVAAVLAPDGSTLTADVVGLTLASTTRAVSAQVELGDDRFAVGAVIDLELPDGTGLPGTVTEIADVVSRTTGGPDGSTTTSTRQVTIVPDGDVPAALAPLVEIPVTLRLVADEVPDALVVPVSALLALAEGGYAVQVVDDPAGGGTLAATHLVGVETGVFSEGFVAVTADGLAAGTRVVVPS